MSDVTIIADGQVTSGILGREEGHLLHIEGTPEDLRAIVALILRALEVGAADAENLLGFAAVSVASRGASPPASTAERA